MISKYPPHGRSIAEGSSSVLINGKPAARVSDAISCGGKVALGSGNVLIGDSPKLLNVEAFNLPKLNTPPLTFDRNPIKDGDSNQTITKAKQHNFESETVKYEVQDHTNETNDTNLRTEPPPPIEQHKNSAVDYWQNKKDQADNFPEYFAAHLLGLNAETGYDIAEGIASTFETVTDPEKFKQSMVNTAQSLADVVTDPKGTYEAIRQSAEDFSNLSSAEQADFAYKTAMGLLAGGGGAGKGVGALGKMGKNKRGNKREDEERGPRQDQTVEKDDSTIADGNVVPNSNGYTQLKLRDAVQLDEFTRLNTKDIGGNAKLRPSEAGAAVEIQNALGGQLRRAEAGEKGDFVFTSGPHQGQSVDFLFTVDTNKAAQMMNKFFDKNPSNLTQIKSHVDKADIVPLDMRNLNMENQNKIMDYIRGLSKEDQFKLILIH